MKRIKEEIVHLLGGYTQEDIRIMTRPQRVAVSRFSIRTLKVCQTINTEVLALYPEYMDHARKDIAYQIADKMIDEGLIEFRSIEEGYNLVKVSALSKIVVPTGGE